MILFRLPPGHDFISAAARPWFYFGCYQAMILFLLSPGHDSISAVVRPWFYFRCGQSMILLWLLPGHVFLSAAARPWFKFDCRQALILFWLPPGHDFISAAGRPWFYQVNKDFLQVFQGSGIEILPGQDLNNSIQIPPSQSCLIKIVTLSQSCRKKSLPHILINVGHSLNSGPAEWEKC